MKTTSSSDMNRAGWKSYALAMAATLAALAVRLGLASWFGDRPALVLFVLPILLSAYAGGMGPGLLATAVAALGTSYFLIPPIHSFAISRPEDTLQWLIMVGGGVLASVLAGAQQTPRRATDGTWSRATERKIQASFAFVLGCLGVIGIVSFLSVQRLREAAAGSAHTQKVIRTLGSLDSAILSAQNAQRGHTLTAEQQFLDAFDAAAKQVGSELEKLKSLTTDNLAQQRRVVALIPLVATRMALAREVIGLRRTQGLDAAKDPQPALQGNQVQNVIAARVAEIEAAEESLLQERNARTDRRSMVAQTVIVGGAGLSFAFVTAALFFIGEDFAGRRRAEAELCANNERLEERVRERTAESERRRAELQVILDTVPALIFFKDREHRLVQVNLEMARVLGRPREELEGRTDAELGSPHADRNRRDEEEIIATGRPKRHVVEPLPTSHGVRWLQTDKIPRRDGSGQIVGIIGFTVDITEQRRAATATALLAAIVESSSDAIVGTDTDGIVTSWNAEAERVFGYAAGEILGQPISRIIPEDRRAEEGQILARIKSGERVEHFETVRRRKDGGLITVTITVSPIRDASGQVVGASKVTRDITEEKRTAKALVASELRYRRLFETAQDGILILDAETGMVDDVNPFLVKALGFSHEQFLGKAIWELGFFRDIVANEDKFAELKEKEYVRYDHLPLETSDGRRIEVEFVSNVYLVDDRKVIQCNIRDVTGRRKAEEAVRASEEYFRFLNDLSEATRGLADPAQIMEVTARMLGVRLRASRCAYADVERDGERFAILHDYTDGCASTVGDYQLSLFGPLAVATLNSGRTLIIRDVEAELLPGEGVEMFSAIGIQAIISCPLVKDGVLRALMAVHQATPRDWKPGEVTLVQDVVERCWATIERRTSEGKVHQLNATLELRVAERTAQLEAANQELEAFSYSVSHDLRAPLRAIDGFSQALVEDHSPRLDEDGQRYLRTIRAGAQRMGALIDDLLAFSRLSRAPLARRTVDTDRLVREALEELAPLREGRKVELRIGTLPACEGDPALLKQVWLNLLSNAHKYSRRRDPAVIEVGCRRDGVEDVFFVRDNGTGFDMRYAGKLFGVFQRLHRAEEFEGTGVGLAIVQRVVHRHGGRVWADSVVDQGATFCFSLGRNPAP